MSHRRSTYAGGANPGGGTALRGQPLHLIRFIHGRTGLLGSVLRSLLRGTAAAFLIAASIHVALAATQPGVVVRFSQPGAAAPADQLIRSNVFLFTPEGESPTPFLKPGPFEAVWSGFVSVDLRGEHSFAAEFSGKLRLEVNGTLLLETEASPTNGLQRTPPIRLNKGTNAFKATLTSPAKGDAFLRLSWVPKVGLPRWVPDAQWSHDPAPADLQASLQRRNGRGLFLDLRCARCHAPETTTPTSPDLALDAPTFDGIGGRRHRAWLAKWIADPAAVRPGATMPKVFHGPAAREEAEAAAAFLATLKPATPTADPAPGEIAAGQKLFETLHCASCHLSPESSESDPARLSLAGVREKFQPGALAAFLLAPSKDYHWIRMPEFRLTPQEAAHLAAYLESKATPPGSAPAEAAPEPALVAKGRALVETRGCVACHQGAGLKNSLQAKAMSALPTNAWTTGCLEATERPDRKAPRFTLTPEEMAAFQKLGPVDRSSLLRFDRIDFTERHVAQLRCTSCHGKFEDFPGFDLLGHKLRPEWSSQFIAGAVPYKPRPWIESRMPGFKAYAAPLAEGLAMLHGHPPKTAPEPPVDTEAAELGRKLVSAEGGFSCISCHGVGKVGATQVFESHGINLAYSGDRLLKGFFHRWFLNPLLLDPATKMPVYFDEEGKSPLSDVLEGSGERQGEAVWQYLRLGDKMAPPPGTAPAP